jgi:hypothetical protein
MAARRIGRPLVEGRSRNGFRSCAVWACVAVLLAGLYVASAGLRGVRAQSAQQPQSANGQQPATQPNAQSDDSSSTLTDGADELLKEFPADSASKAATDPRDGHTDTPPGTPAPPPDDSAQADDEPPLATTAEPAPAPAAAPAPPPPAFIELPSDPKQRQVAIECNDLLKMALDLKSAVDKSTKDELSLDVVRRAGELEQYARKVRNGTRMTAGK